MEVAHEALLQEWRRLREWLDESRADIRMQRVLGNAAAEWIDADREVGFLLTRFTPGAVRSLGGRDRPGTDGR